MSRLVYYSFIYYYFVGYCPTSAGGVQWRNWRLWNTPPWWKPLKSIYNPSRNENTCMTRSVDVSWISIFWNPLATTAPPCRARGWVKGVCFHAQVVWCRVAWCALSHLRLQQKVNNYETRPFIFSLVSTALLSSVRVSSLLFSTNCWVASWIWARWTVWSLEGSPRK